ncbi:MAG: Loki-CTERM sorting domain-containing protein [Promethearchaeota archaeon]
MKANRNLGILLTFLTLSICFSLIILLPHKNDLRNDEFFNDFNNEKLKISSYFELSPFIIEGLAGGVGAHNWTWVESQYWFGGGDGSWSNPYIIENISIDGNGVGNCLEIKFSEVYFALRYCSFYNSGTDLTDAGLRLETVSNGAVINNNCSDNGCNGIIMKDCTKNTISGNIINNNSYIRKDGAQPRGYGIHLSRCVNNTISENIVSSNGFTGMLLEIHSDYNQILYNKGHNNIDRGLWLIGSSYNNIIGNLFCGSFLNYYESGTSGNNLKDNNFECKQPKTIIPGYSIVIIGIIIAISTILIKKKKGILLFHT